MMMVEIFHGDLGIQWEIGEGNRHPKCPSYIFQMGELLHLIRQYWVVQSIPPICFAVISSSGPYHWHGTVPIIF